MNKPCRLAIIGAGALTESIYLPVLKNSRFFHVSCLVDTNSVQAQKMAKLYNIPTLLQDVHEISKEDIDAALVVLPNFLHYSVSLSLIRKGIHVLVEKPMTNTVEESLLLIEAAKSANVRLAVGLVRRFYPVTSVLKGIVNNKTFGNLQSFDFEEGHVFEWKLQSDYLLSKHKAGGGVLMDTGVHTLDQLVHCIGFPDRVEYFDDSKGGVEADCLLKLEMADGVKGLVRFSRIRKLRNTMIFQFEKAKIEVGLNANSDLSITLNNISSVITAQVNSEDGSTFKNKDAFNAQLHDFGTAIREERSCRVNGEEGMLSIQLIDKCYASRKPIFDRQISF